MAGFKGALSAIGLIELDEKEQAEMVAKKKAQAKSPTDDELEALLATDLSDLAAEPSAPSPAPVVTGITETSSLEEIYAEAGVPESPYPAEKLIALLKGLSSMPAPQRKIAVEAMDAADSSWTVTDPLNDANAKIKALNGAKARFAQLVSSAEQETSAKIKELEDFEVQATAAIREEIAQLEAKLAAEVKNITEEKAQLAAQLEVKRNACTNETAKLDNEVRNLHELAQFLAPPSSPSTVSTGE